MHTINYRKASENGRNLLLKTEFRVDLKMKYLTKWVVHHEVTSSWILYFSIIVEQADYIMLAGEQGEKLQ